MAEEKTALLKQCEESVSAKVEETEHIKLQMEEAQQELLFTKKQVSLTHLSYSGDFNNSCLLYLFIEVKVLDEVGKLNTNELHKENKTSLTGAGLPLVTFQQA